MEKLKTLIPALVEVAAAAFVLHSFFWQIQAFDPVIRRFLFQETPVWSVPLAISVAALLLLLLPLKENGWQGLRQSGRNWLPLIPAALLLLIPFTFSPLPLLGAIALIAWGCFRHCSSSDAPLPFEDRLRPLTYRGGLYFSIALALAGCGLAFYMQTCAYDRMFLYYSDWGIYAEHYLKLAAGNGTLHDWLVAGGHWNGALNVLMAGAFAISPAPGTIFFINGILIYSAVPLLYLLGKELKLPASVSAVFAVLFVLTPVVSNQPLSLFYSFHPINVLPSCFLLFFLFRERKQYAAAIAVIVLTLFVQETVTIFWFGYALTLAAEKKYRQSLILGILMLTTFIVLSHWAIPAGARMPDGNYTQMFHYSQLGTTPLEVALSPLLRPMAFFGTLFAINNFEFALFLLIPVLFLAPHRPKLLLAGLPLAAGVCLQSSRDLQNVVLQYGVELNLLAITSALFGAAHLYAQGDRKRLRGALAAALFAVAALYLLSGKSIVPGGKYPFSRIQGFPEASEVRTFLKNNLPPNTIVYAPQQLRAQLLFDHPTADVYDSLPVGGIAIFEAEDPARLTALRNPALVPITHLYWYGREFAVFGKLDRPVTPPPLPFLKPVTPEEFVAFGAAVESDSREFRIRSRSTNESVQLLFRLTRQTTQDFRFYIEINRNGESAVYLLTFAHGLRPASAVETGTGFFVEFPMPEGSGPVAIFITTQPLGVTAPTP